MPAGSRALGSQAQMCGSLQEPRSDCGLPLLGATGGEPTLNASNQHGMGATADSPYFMPSVEEASPGVESSRHRGYELDDGDYDDEDDTDGGRAGTLEASEAEDGAHGSARKGYSSDVTAARSPRGSRVPHSDDEDNQPACHCRGALSEPESTSRAADCSDPRELTRELPRLPRAAHAAGSRLLSFGFDQSRRLPPRGSRRTAAASQPRQQRAAKAYAHSRESHDLGLPRTSRGRMAGSLEAAQALSTDPLIWTGGSPPPPTTTTASSSFGGLPPLATDALPPPMIAATQRCASVSAQCRPHSFFPTLLAQPCSALFP